ncbi:hypothetical protein LshimejAT787_1103610 [Lyophyllum shimeji]|uniref:Transmembrane protein n=1 Tax=Lyophyllum shimeji TaxID=47721 RepID=A0A9P3PW82_LYOSH|nr:hypothetical protein LshimejAT787_1103610 [Lyophyllum shimeji]
MSTNLVEQRLPVFIQLFSRIPTWAHFMASVLAILVLWARPSLAPAMPMPSINSTLVDRTSDDDDELAESEDLRRELGEVRHKFHNPFSKLARPVKHAMSPTLACGRSYARKVSLSGKHLAEHFAHAIAPFHHHHSLDARTSYFAPHDFVYPTVVMEAKVEVEIEVVGVEQDVSVPDSQASHAAAPRKPTKFKRIVMKAKALLRIRSRRL